MATISTTPSTPRRKRLDRDQRHDILLLRRRGDSYAEIAQFLGITERAVQYTCNTKYATPQHKRTGRPSKLTSTEVDELIEFVKTSKRTRRLTYQQLKDELYKGRDDVGAEAIRYALRKREHHRQVTLRKPPISKTNKIRRLEWAHEHLHWPKAQWHSVLWTDETWVTAGQHRLTWVTRCAGEELDPTCVIERVQRKTGWITWRSFAGFPEGPYVFWEKDWSYAVPGLFSLSTDTWADLLDKILQGHVTEQ